MTLTSAPSLFAPPLDDQPPLVQQLMAEWENNLLRGPDLPADWQADGGHWSAYTDGMRLQGDGSGQAGCRWLRFRPPVLRDLQNVRIEVTLSGRAEAAGLSFGPGQDFLAALNDSARSRRLQVEIDLSAGRWIFRVDGQVQDRSEWDAGARTVERLAEGLFTLKAHQAELVRFHDLAIRVFPASCRLSVILTCYRFLQRLRITLRNWCHQTLPAGAHELLVVNPQSPDGTHEHLAAVMRSYPQLRVREVLVEAKLATNKGMMINRALKASSGDWIWLTDADCLFAPNRAAAVLAQIQGRESYMFYGQRQYLTSQQTAALLSGRLDGLHDFETLSQCPPVLKPDCLPWGYTQIVHRSVMERILYREDFNNFAHSDMKFLEACKRCGLTIEPLPDLSCLHLAHPFAWFGTNTFL